MSRKCDFCGGEDLRPPIRVFRPGESIVLQFPDLTVVDGPPGWMACPQCAALIDGERWPDLMRRVQELSPAMQMAREFGRLPDVSRFVAGLWSKVFGKRPEAFLEEHAA